MEVEAALFSFLRGRKEKRTVYKAGWVCPECGELVSHDAVIPVECNDEQLFGCCVRDLPAYQRNMPMAWGRN